AVDQGVGSGFGSDGGEQMLLEIQKTGHVRGAAEPGQRKSVARDIATAANAGLEGAQFGKHRRVEAGPLADGLPKRIISERSSAGAGDLFRRQSPQAMKLAKRKHPGGRMEDALEQGGAASPRSRNVDDLRLHACF